MNYMKLTELPLHEMLNVIGNHYDRYEPIYKKELVDICKKLNINAIKLVNDIDKEIKKL